MMSTKKILIILVAFSLLTPSLILGNSQFSYDNSAETMSEDVIAFNEPPIVLPTNGTNGTIPITNGSVVAINPGESLELLTPSGISLNLQVGAALEINITELEVNPVESVPNGTFDIGIFLDIEVNDTETEVNATFKMAYNETALEEINVNASTGRFMFYNETAEEWQLPEQSWVNTTEAVIYANTTHFSIWTVVFDEPQQQPPTTTQPPTTQPPSTTQPPGGPPTDYIPVTIPNGTPVEVQPGQGVNLTTPSGISIALVVGEGISINVTELTVNPAAPLPDGVFDIGIYLDIEVNDTDVNLNATLMAPFDPSEVAKRGITDVSTLTFMYYDEQAKKWVPVDSVVDTARNIVYANVTHFSVWTIASLSESEDTSAASTPGFGLLALIATVTALIPIYHYQRRRREN